MQRKMGEHQQVFQKSEGEQQETTGRFQDMSLFPSIGRPLQGEKQDGD